MKHIAAITIMAGLIIALGCNYGPGKPIAKQQSSGPTIGQPAPEIEGVDLEGVEFKLSDYRGKVVMLDFYGDW